MEKCSTQMEMLLTRSLAGGGAWLGSVGRSESTDISDIFTKSNSKIRLTIFDGVEASGL